MIRVLTVGNHPSVKGGITSVIDQIRAHDWAADGVEMRFIPTYVEKNNLLKLGYFGFAYLRILARMLFHRPDAVHIHMSYKGSFTRKYAIHRLCRRFGVRDILHLHGSEFESWYDSCPPDKQAQIRRLLRECDRFIVLGDKWDAAVRRIEPQTRTLVVSNTVAIPAQTAAWDDAECRILFLGVLIRRKGVEDLLNAVRQLVDSGRWGHKKLILAGTGAEEERLKEQCAALGLNDSVTFAGWTAGEKKTALMRSCQVLVLPSYHEGLPMAILEAMSYGMPVVATDVGDVSSAVRTGENGWLIAPGDIERLADAIAAADDPAVWSAYAQASRRIAENEFSDSRYFARLAGVYRRTEE